MRDVGAKSDTLRTALARATLRVSPSTLELLRQGKAPKGDPLPVARVAAIQAAKHTPTIIPYCHSVPLDLVTVGFELAEEEIQVTVEVRAIYRTGVEMEALTGASVAALTLYDMLKPVDSDLRITDIVLLEKTGGKTSYDVPQFRSKIVVVSDRVSSGTRSDVTGPTLREALEALGAEVDELVIVPDEPECIREAALEGVAAGCDFLFVAGGTGLGPRDRTPEALTPLIEQSLPGVEDHLRGYFQKRVPTAMLSRVLVGRRGDTILIALPGSPGAARDAVDALFPYITHALHIMRGGDHGPV